MTLDDALTLLRNWAATARYVRRHRRVSELRMKVLADDLAQLDQEALYCWIADRVASGLEGVTHVIEDRIHKDPTEPGQLVLELPEEPP